MKPIRALRLMGSERKGGGGNSTHAYTQAGLYVRAYLCVDVLFCKSLFVHDLMRQRAYIWKQNGMAKAIIVKYRFKE